MVASRRCVPAQRQVLETMPSVRFYPLARKMHRLGRISYWPAGHDWLHALAGCCPSPVIGKAVFARFVSGATSNGLHVGATLWYFRDLKKAAATHPAGRKRGVQIAGISSPVP